MRLWRLLILPGQALSQMSRHMVLAAAGVMLGLCVWIGPHAYSHSVSWTLDAAHIAAQLNAVAWVCLSNVLLLARDARRLRLPAIERDVLASLALYAVLGIVLPTLWLGALGGPARVIVVELLLGAGLGMAYAVLPSYLAMLAVFLGTSHWLPLPGSAQPGFTTWAGPFSVLVWLMVWLRWRAVLRDGHGAEGIHAPMLFVIRLGLWNRGGGTMGVGRNNLLNRQGPEWMRPAVDLRGSGPGHTQQSLRVALGGLFVPQTPVSRLRQTVILLLSLALGALLIVAPWADHAGNGAVWFREIGGTGLLIEFGAFGSAILALSTMKWLQQRWQKNNAELPLLALLPGLADAAKMKRALLHASLLPALCVQAALWLVLMIMAVSMHVGEEGEVLLSLSQLGGVGLMLAFVLAVFGGVSLHGWGFTLLGAAGYIWICATAGLPLFSDGSRIAPDHGTVLALAMGWAALAVALLWLGRRGWCEPPRDLRRLQLLREWSHEQVQKVFP